MANYPFRVNMATKTGQNIAYMSSSFATDTDTVISASAMVDKINLLPSASYEDGTLYPGSSSNAQAAHLFGGGRNLYLSASIITHPNTGSVVFTDTETTDNGGLDFYTFWGTKVCSVLGIPEGIPIYTENFKLSDDSSNPSNYLSGDVIADGIAIKESFKIAPQGRMRSNLVWDHQFGEGLLQWVSGSSTKMTLGYDDQNDRYRLSAPTASVSRLEVNSGANGNEDFYFRSITGTADKNYWMPYELHCGFNYSSGGGTQVVVPLNGTITEVTSTTNYTEYQTWIAPFDCIWKKVFARSESIPGFTWINMLKVADGTEGATLGGGSNTEGDAFTTLDMTSANTVYIDTGTTATSGGSIYVAKGETIIFTFDPTVDSNDTVMTFLFMMDPATALF